MDNTERFKTFINARFLAWEQAIGKRGTVKDFARDIGTYQGDVSHWMAGDRIPGLKALQKITNSPWIGPEAWEAAGYGYLVKDPELIRVLVALDSLPRSIQERFATEAERMAREHGTADNLHDLTALQVA